MKNVRHEFSTEETKRTKKNINAFEANTLRLSGGIN
jgi:hypothetical protein